jgi:hypothetical protein
MHAWHSHDTHLMMISQAFPLEVSLPRVSLLASTHKADSTLKKSQKHAEPSTTSPHLSPTDSDSVISSNEAAGQRAYYLSKREGKLGHASEQQSRGHNIQSRGLNIQSRGISFQLGTPAARLDTLIELSLQKVNVSLTKSTMPHNNHMHRDMACDHADNE